MDVQDFEFQKLSTRKPQACRFMVLICCWYHRGGPVEIGQL